MKRLLLTCLSSLAMSVVMFAQGWPSHYGGVMLQGFYWDSYDETNWNALTNQADELSQYFDLIWVPNSGTTSSYAHDAKAKTMGYDPCYWLKHDSSFGTESELRNMISTFKAKGTGIIEDVVVNHKNGLNDWCDFPNETVTGKNTGKTYSLTWSLADICQNDECANNNYKPTGANDTGENFDGFRDLDHTSTNVQNNIDVYLDFLLNEMGYAGFRYDMVKGFAPMYVKQYNEAAQPMFSVGEHFSNAGEVGAWIRGTGLTSAAFDFGLKRTINNCFGQGNWDISDKGNAADINLSRYAVTFVENHDTDKTDGQKLNNNVLAANAFILALPGTPCLFWKHWTAYKDELKKMIDARKEAGITNTSRIVYQAKHNDGYVTIVEGDNRNILVISGYPEGINDILKDYDCVSCGTNENPNYAFYISKNKPTSSTEGITIYVHSSNAPHLYVWEGTDTELNGGWPGALMSDVCFIGSDKYYYKKFTPSSGSLKFIVNNGNDSEKTEDIMNITGNVFYTYDGNTSAIDVTSEMNGKELRSLPTYSNGEVCAFFEASGTDYQNVKAWAWNGSVKYTGRKWPGQECTRLADLPNGNKLWKWTASDSNATPEYIIFNNDDKGNQTGNLAFVNGGHYKVDGLFSIVDGVVSDTETEQISSREFTNGQFSTLCLPYNISEKELKQYGGSFYKYSSETDGVLYFSKVSSLMAWYPYVYIPSATGQNLAALASAQTTGGAPKKVKHGNFTFIGTSTARTLVSNNDVTYYGYKITDGMFIKVGTDKGAKIGAWKCYFSTPAKSGASAKYSVFDGVATGIATVKEIMDRSSSDVYTIDGKKVEKNGVRKGLYIYNGKKLIVR